jgi:hypothetical protein
MRSNWVEINTSKPVFVTLSSHNVLTSVHVPDLPRAIVRHGSNNLLTHVEGEARNRSLMSFNTLAGRHALSDGFISSRKVRVRSGVFGIRSVLVDSHAESASSKAFIFTLSRLSLSSVAFLNLFLNIRLVFLHFGL